MKLIINTTELKEMVSKAEKGAGNNKLLPITSLMGISYADKFTLTTTDGTNYLCVTKDMQAPVNEAFEVAVAVDRFAKLIARMTCEQVSIEIIDNYLQVSGNGTYKIELPYDENGAVVKYKNPADKLVNSKISEEGTITTATVRQIITSVKPSLSVTPEVPCYMHYYAGDKVVGTDTYTIADLEYKMFEQPVLISVELMNLLSLTNDAQPKYTVYADGNIKFEASDCQIYGRCADGLDEYAISAIDKLINKSFVSSCEISKDAILQLLDRLMLFVAPYDKNGVTLTFAEDALLVESLNSSGVEQINYLRMDNVVPATYTIDIQVLQAQIKASLGDNVEIHWGADSAIKLNSGKLVQILALLED